MIYQNLESNPKPLVSMVIITYNQETMVSQTIESLLKQETTYPFEIIIADDCSKDNTLQVCLEYYKKYPSIIRVIENEPNKGFMRNYHETISEYARGKYIAPIAGDDWWNDIHKIQMQVDFLENHSDYDMVYSDSYVYSEKKHCLEKYKPNNVSVSFIQLMQYNCILALTACYTKKIFLEYLKEIKPVQNGFCCEDYPLWLWISFHSKIYYIELPLTTYRMQEKSLSHFVSQQKFYDFLINTFKIKLFFYDYFQINNKKLLHDMYLEFYASTLILSSKLNDKKVLHDRLSFFKNEKLYFYYILSIINSVLAGKVPLLFIRILNSFGHKRSHFKVFS